MRSHDSRSPARSRSSRPSDVAGVIAMTAPPNLLRYHPALPSGVNTSRGLSHPQFPADRGVARTTDRGSRSGYAPVRRKLGMTQGLAGLSGDGVGVESLLDMTAVPQKRLLWTGWGW